MLKFRRVVAGTAAAAALLGGVACGGSNEAGERASAKPEPEAKGEADAADGVDHFCEQAGVLDAAFGGADADAAPDGAEADGAGEGESGDVPEEAALGALSKAADELDPPAELADEFADLREGVDAMMAVMGAEGGTPTAEELADLPDRIAQIEESGAAISDYVEKNCTASDPEPGASS